MVAALKCCISVDFSIVKRVGVIGGGQLAWMMASAAKSLDIELVVQTPNYYEPAVSTASDVILAPVNDAAATARLASRCDVITFENEFVNLEALQPLVKQGVCFRPSLEALAPLLDKYDQRCYLQGLGLSVPEFVAITGEKQTIAQKLPAVLKVRRHGYDGQGTFIINSRDALESILQKLGETPALLEEFIPFERELAAIAARSLDGEVVVYPVVETQQQDGVCRRVLVPAEIGSTIKEEVEAIARTLLNSLQAVGVFGIELFLTSAGKILVNEIAPRTHNSGHFSLDASVTSQFEQHLRAVCQLPLGNPALNCRGAVMVNLLGYEHSQDPYEFKRQQLAAIPQARVYWYGKKESRPGRKLGHVTALLPSADRETALSVARTIESIWYGT